VEISLIAGRLLPNKENVSTQLSSDKVIIYTHPYEHNLS